METDDEDLDCSLPSNQEIAKENTLQLLPLKSKERYECTYNQFMNWHEEKPVKTSLSENVLLTYFGELARKIAPSSLWTQYSMLKSTLSIHQNVDIAQYIKLRAFIKRKADGYKPKKSITLTTQEINRFLSEAPDDQYLLVKVILLVGISGACRKYELVQLKIDDMEDLGSAVLIKISDTKTKRHRSFAITGEFYKIYKKYAALRPINISEQRFFLNYQNKKCTLQPIGINKIASAPKQIATYLCLKEPKLYTGHCFRRSSATVFVDAGGDISTLKRHGGWKSSAVTAACIEENNKIKAADSIMNSIEPDYYENESHFLDFNRVPSNEHIPTFQEIKLEEIESGYCEETEHFDSNDPLPILLDHLQGRTSKVEEQQWKNDEISSKISVKDISMIKTETDDSSTPSSSSMFDSPEKNSESQIESDCGEPMQTKTCQGSVDKDVHVHNQLDQNVPQQSVIEPELPTIEVSRRSRKRYSDLMRRNQKILLARELRKLRLMKQQVLLSIQKLELMRLNNEMAQRRLNLLEEQNNMLRTMVRRTNRARA